MKFNTSDPLHLPVVPIFPARYQLQHYDDQTHTWKKVGNGCVIRRPLLKRMHRAMRHTVGAFRVWDLRTETDATSGEDA